MKRTASVVLIPLFVAGCDFFESKANKVEILKLEQQQAERAATQKKDAAEALKTYIEGKCKLVQADALTVSNALTAVEADVTRFERTVALEMNGVSVSNENRMVVNAFAAVLKNPIINEIAQKYLATGFSTQAGLFSDRVKIALSEERVYRDAIRKAEQIYERSVTATGKWQTNTAASREKEIRRLQSEIVKLERKKDQEWKKLSGTKTMEQARRANISEYEYEITRKRRQIDYLRQPVQANRAEGDAAEIQLSVRRRAESERNDALWDINRHLKPKASVQDIVRETEAQTIGLLRKAIQDSKAALVKKQAVLLSQVRAAAEAMLEVPVCDENELKQLRRRLDKALSIGTAL